VSIYEMLKEMARAVLKYAFAALLAFLSTQAVVPSPPIKAGIEFVCSTKAEQQITQEARGIRPAIRVRQTAPPYTSRTKSEPDAAVLFERPPPTFSLL
jgi:hypothetical protein